MEQPSSAAPTEPASSLELTPTDGGDGPPLGVLVGVAAAAGVALLVLAAIAAWCACKRKARPIKSIETAGVPSTPPTSDVVV